MNPALRWLVAALGWLLLVGASLFWLADAGPGRPWSPQERLDLDPGLLEGESAQLHQERGGLRITGADGNGITLVVQPRSAFPADRFRYLRLELAEVPGVLRAMAVWRRDGALHAAPMPGAFHAAATLDLRDSPGWAGELEAVGFALLPTDYLAPFATVDREFRFVRAHFESDSVSGSLRALWTQWTAYRPWNGRSNHTGGFELSTVPGPSLQLFLFCLLVASLLAIAVGGGLSALSRAAVPLLIVVLAVPALRQAAQLGMRAEVAAQARRAIDGRPQWPLAALPQLGHEALRLLEQLEPPPPRLIVWGESGFMREYPTWLLRAANAASLDAPHRLNSASLVGSVLVLAGSGPWEHDPGNGTLRLSGVELAVEPVFAGNVLKAYRLRGARP